jgi:hypothetical protein
MLRLPITGFARYVPDSVERAMAILKDRPDPAEKPQAGLQAAPAPARSNSRSSR